VPFSPGTHLHLRLGHVRFISNANPHRQVEALFWQALAARGVLAERVDAAASRAPPPPPLPTARGVPGRGNDECDEGDEELAWRVPAGTACQDPGIGIYRLRLRSDWAARQATRSWAQVD
jgi:hypothetical protein